MGRDIEAIFHEVCGLAPEARSEYYVGHGIRDEVRSEVESLLAHDGVTDSGLIDRVASHVGVWMRNKGSEASFGPFRLQRLLGGGGPFPFGLKRW